MPTMIKVLIVDDDADVRSLVAKVLNEAIASSAARKTSDVE
jgi:CheY-like chemotaxis protein